MVRRLINKQTIARGARIASFNVCYHSRISGRDAGAHNTHGCLIWIDKRLIWVCSFRSRYLTVIDWGENIIVVTHNRVSQLHA